MVRQLVLFLAILFFSLTGCSNNNDREFELQQFIQAFNTSIIEKDIKTQNKLFARGIVDVEQANEGNNFFSFETITERIEGDEAAVKLKTDFEELQINNEYMNFIGYFTLTLSYESTGWIITNIETEIDPSTPRPQRP